MQQKLLEDYEKEIQNGNCSSESSEVCDSNAANEKKINRESKSSTPSSKGKCIEIS